MFQSILVPIDFESQSTAAFTHGLALALAAGAKLRIVHVGKSQRDDPPWDRYPAVRNTLRQWDLIDEHVSRQDVAQTIGIDIGKIEIRGKNAGTEIVRYLNDHSVDLIVAGTGARGGLMRLIKPSTAARIAKEIRVKTLFLPGSARGFVNADTGKFALRRLIVPVDATPDPGPALQTAKSITSLLHRDQPLQIEIVHAGNAMPPSVHTPTSDSFADCATFCKPGDPLDVISERSVQADLVIMTTAGRHGLLEDFLGSTAERVLERATCPVLTVPA